MAQAAQQLAAQLSALHSAGKLTADYALGAFQRLQQLAIHLAGERDRHRASASQASALKMTHICVSSVHSKRLKLP